MSNKRKYPVTARYNPVGNNGAPGILREAPEQFPSGKKKIEISPKFQPNADVVLYHGDCIELLSTIPNSTVTLIVTSPPYNIGKVYERRRKLEEYLSLQEVVIKECVRLLAEGGSICWQVGNYVENNEILPLDIALYPLFKKFGLKMRNRIIWHFEHGLHCSHRFSGRYETIIWFTKGDRYKFHLDPVRVPQKYPHKKHFKGPKVGQFSCNPLGKNPGDLWIIPNVKHNHVEKTPHPCQFPVELIERFVLALTDPGDWVLDPFVGVGTTLVASLLHSRRSAGAETIEEYVRIARDRVKAASLGKLRTRPMARPIYDPNASKTYPREFQFLADSQEVLFPNLSNG